MDKDQEKSIAKEAPTAKDNKIIFAEILKKKKEKINEKNFKNSKEAKGSNFRNTRSNSPQRIGKGRRGK